MFARHIQYIDMQLFILSIQLQMTIHKILPLLYLFILGFFISMLIFFPIKKEQKKSAKHLHNKFEESAGRNYQISLPCLL